MLPETRDTDEVYESSQSDGREGFNALREKLSFVLESWWTSRLGRQKAEEALKSLAALELEVAQLRRQNRHQKSVLEELQEELQGQEDQSKSVSLSRRWLVETFTEGSCDMMTSGSRRSSISSAKLLDEELKPALEPILRAETEAALLDGAGKLDFDVCIDLGKRPLLQVLFKAAVKQDALLEKIAEQGHLVSQAEFLKSLYAFLGKIEDMYHENPYHNVKHAADVMMTMEFFLRTPGLSSQVSELDHVMVLVSCAIHDVGHDGRNNLFHTKTMSPLAVTYNDKSVLENMHVSSAFRIQQDSRYNWLSHLSTEFLPEDAVKPMNLKPAVRRQVVDLVLGTDMTKHNQHQKNLITRLEALEEGQAKGEKMELLEAIVHAADISNPCKPRALMLYWTQRVVEEFWAQGDEELRLGIEVSPMCDRSVGEDSIPKQQLGFIDFIIAPFYSPLADLLPEVREATTNMAANRAFWVEKEAEQVHFSHLFKESVAV